MLKKIEIIEKYQSLFSGGEMVADLQSKFHPDMVAVWLSEAYDYLLAESYGRSGTNIVGRNSSFLDVYTIPYPRIAVSFDSARQEYYSTLPVNVVTLPNNDGVRMICPVRGQVRPYIPVSNNAFQIFDELEIGSLSTDTTYYIESGNKVFYNIFGSIPDEVMMKLVPCFEDLDDNDKTEEPAIMTRNGLVGMYELIIGRIQGMPPEKVINNNNSNTPA